MNTDSDQKRSSDTDRQQDDADTQHSMRLKCSLRHRINIMESGYENDFQNHSVPSFTVLCASTLFKVWSSTRLCFLMGRSRK
jgi:hypothetical protein